MIVNNGAVPKQSDKTESFKEALMETISKDFKTQLCPTVLTLLPILHNLEAPFYMTLTIDGYYRDKEFCGNICFNVERRDEDVFEFNLSQNGSVKGKIKFTEGKAKLSQVKITWSCDDDFDHPWYDDGEFELNIDVEKLDLI